MNTKKQFRPADLRTLLAVALVIITLGGGALFYLGLTAVREYAVTVAERGVDAEASRQQIQELQRLKNQLTQSNALVEKADKLFATPDNYQSKALNDVRAYASAAGLSIANTSFSSPSEGGSYAITVSFKEPVSFTKLIAFLNNVEGNIPKLQVSEISLDHVAGGDKDSVSVGDIKIDIAVR